MAKKKGKRPAAARTKVKKTASKGTRKALAPKRRTPASQVLPGMEQVREVALDRLCEQIGDVRDTMNQAKTDEKSLIASALQRMSRSSEKFPQGRTVYKHARVELTRVPGADKLRVRVTKEDGDADDNDQVGDERRDAVEELGEATAGEAEA